VFAVVTAYIVLGERLTTNEIIGGTLVLASSLGLALFQREPQHRER
jgi:drug/metabolite transporter (DMT)-like permease